jgi:hypothetical protein
MGRPRKTVLATGSTVETEATQEEVQAEQEEAQKIKARADAELDASQPEPEPEPVEDSTLRKVRYGTEMITLQPGEPLQDPEQGTETPTWKAWKAEQKK